MYHISFKNISGETIALKKVEYNQSLLDVAMDNDVEVHSLCGGAGTCKKCKVRIIQGLNHIDYRDKEPTDSHYYACKCSLQKGAGIISIELL